MKKIDVNLLKSTGIAGLSLFTLTGCIKKKDTQQLPNIIYILADDLGYGDLSCYGQTKFSTPNIDRLAIEGMRFTQHYAGSTVCAPSRSCLMTGFHTGRTPIRGNKSVLPEGQQPLPDKALTIAEMLKQAGYLTGAFGKWGLGFKENEGSPLKQGFDQFYGYYCQSLAHRYYPEYLWDNTKKIKLRNNGDTTIDYAADLIHNEALQFIDKHCDTSFFLFLPYTIPHAELIVPDDELVEQYRGNFLPEKVYKGMDYGDNYNPRGYCSQDECHAVFAAMVTRLDKYVGEILEKVKEHGLDKNTLVIFTSDNGPHMEGGADPDYFNSNGIFKGYKRDLYEGGIRVPMLARWKNRINPGSQTNHISAFWDILPTLAEIAGTETPDTIDGISFLPTLTGKKNQHNHDYLYWEFHEQGGKQAVRMDQWKGIRMNVEKDSEGEIELYNLSVDPGEERNTAIEYPEMVTKIDSIMRIAHKPSALFPFGQEREQISK